MPSILLVECHEEFATVVAMRLRDAGFFVTVVPDTLAALDVLGTKASCDVLITRARMCGGMPHGFALARIALSQRPSLRVIYITRFDVPEAERQDAAGPILSAPLDAEDIVREVERLLAPSLG